LKSRSYFVSWKMLGSCVYLLKRSRCRLIFIINVTTAQYKLSYCLTQLSIRQLLKCIFSYISQLHVSARPSWAIFRVNFLKKYVRAETCSGEIRLKIHFNNWLIESCDRPYILYFYIIILLLKHNGDISHDDIKCNCVVTLKCVCLGSNFITISSFSYQF
jgi:hypothetical protein